MEDKNVKPIERQKFYNAILEAYEDGKEMTARECSKSLMRTGLTVFGIRQEVAPRITELVEKGLLAKCGTKVDFTSKKTVTIYKKVV